MFAYSTFSAEPGSSPSCCTRLLAAVIGLRISCAIDADSSSSERSFSSSRTIRWRDTLRATWRSTSTRTHFLRRPGAMTTWNACEARPMPQPSPTTVATNALLVTNRRNRITNTYETRCWKNLILCSAIRCASSSGVSSRPRRRERRRSRISSRASRSPRRTSSRASSIARRTSSRGSPCSERPLPRPGRLQSGRPWRWRLRHFSQSSQSWGMRFTPQGPSAPNRKASEGPGRALWIVDRRIEQAREQATCPRLRARRGLPACGRRGNPAARPWQCRGRAAAPD